MGWEHIEFPPSGRGYENVRMSCIQKDRTLGISYSIPAPMQRALGWDQDTRVRLQIGNGPDAGRLLIEPAEDGKKLLAVRRSRSLRLVTQVFPWMAGTAQKRPQEDVESRVRGSALILRLPAWARRPAEEDAAPAPISLEAAKRRAGVR